MNALSPAKVSRVSIVDEEQRIMEVVVEDKQLSPRHRQEGPERPPGRQARGLAHRHQERGREAPGGRGRDGAHGSASSRSCAASRPHGVARQGRAEADRRRRRRPRPPPRDDATRSCSTIEGIGPEDRGEDPRGGGRAPRRNGTRATPRRRRGSRPSGVEAERLAAEAEARPAGRGAGGRGAGGRGARRPRTRAAPTEATEPRTPRRAARRRGGAAAGARRRAGRGAGWGTLGSSSWRGI